jgi:hypothetical protein
MSKKKTAPPPTSWQANGTFSVTSPKAMPPAEWTAKLQEKIKQAWIPPLSAPAGLSCNAKVRLAADGTITQIAVFSPCKENPLFSSAIESALKTASPLPVPPQSAQNFNVFIFTFKFETAR